VKTFVDGFNSGESEEIRYWSLIGLSKAGNQYHASIFRKSLRNEWEKAGAIEAAIYGLGRVGKSKDWRYLKSFISSLQPSYVVNALKAAGMLKAKNALSLIESKMADENPAISKAAITALGSFKGYAIIATLIRFKHEHSASADMDLIIRLLRKNKAAPKYAILKARMNLRKKPTDRSDRITVLDNNSVVKIVKAEKRKYSITDNKTGQELTDFWYQVQNGKGKKGYLFGAYIIIVDTYN